MFDNDGRGDRDSDGDADGDLVKKVGVFGAV
jgi:hypothetical protein